MRVAILHNSVSPTAGADEKDVLVQVATVSEALRSLGHEVIAVPCTLNLDTLRQRLVAIEPGIVFNLVESLGGSDGLMHLATALLDVLGLPYTGAPTEALFLSTHKVLAKQHMRVAGLPTPDWIALDGAVGTAVSSGFCREANDRKMSYIIKSVYEHASVGLDDESVLSGIDVNEVRHRLAGVAALVGRPCFAERFVAGREFNLSLLGGYGEPQILPPAEIDFSGFPPEKPRIVGYRAKWEEDSIEYQNTPRRFAFPPSDQPLINRLCTLAHTCWNLLGLRGYARVDFRVDSSGQPWILEANANPCLSPDAGFAAALAHGSIRYADAIERIIDDTLNKMDLTKRPQFNRR